MQSTIIVIIGPTAVGKTKLAIDLALHLNTEIISADSRQFYKEISIGTAKPTDEELLQIRHHFINNRSIKEYYSAGDFEKEALLKTEELFAQGNRSIIVVGGSGLYIKAFSEGLDEMPEADLNLRNELVQKFEVLGLDWLQEELKRLDPEKYKTIDNRNPQRLMRALELHFQGGILKTEKKPRAFKIIKVGLELPREQLYQRINQRVMDMMDAGLLEEVELMWPLKEMNALQTVGYNELFDFFEGKTDLKKAVELIQQHTRNYAKRQITWFKADPEIKWFNPFEGEKTLKWIDSQLAE